MSKLIYVNFETRNFKNERVLSGYALPTSTFTFTPLLTSTEAAISNKRITWNYGDGTFSSEVTGSHAYNWPGVYPISFAVYTEDGDAFVSSYTTTVSVYDFIDNRLIIEPPAAIVSSYPILAGRRLPINVIRRNSWQTYSALSGSAYTINLYASGSPVPMLNVETYINDAWSHLKLYSSFYIQLSTGNTVEYTPISSVQTTTTKLYANADATGEYQLCKATDDGALFVGTSGGATAYFTCHQPKNYSLSGSPLYIFGSFDTSKFVDQFTLSNNYFAYNTPTLSYLNSSPDTLSVLCLYNSASYLSITTNGIDTNGDAILSAFEMPAISWQNTAIPFVVKLKDDADFTTLFYPLLSSSNSNYTVRLSLVSGASALPCTFYSDFLDTMPTDVGGYYKGYFICPISATNVVLSAAVIVQNPVYMTTGFTAVSAVSSRVAGISNPFNIFSQNGVYNITKQGEDFDMKAYFNTLRLTDYLADKDSLFDSFFGSIVGDAQGAPYELGKTVYEKITNFVSNNSDIDTANIDALISICKQVGTKIESVVYSYPPQLKRIIDILSIKRSQLYGNTNQFNIDFNRQGSTNAIQYATNLGQQINITTGTFSLSEKIVANELFSGNFTVVQMPASGYPPTQVFQLSTYSSNWNLGLITAPSVTGVEVGNYYKFYRYIPSTTGEVLDSVVNWTDSTLTLSFYNSTFAAWSTDDGIMDSIINYELTKGLRLFTSAAEIVYNN